MGLKSAGDEYDRRGDVALAGIQQIGKIRDDILAWDVSFVDHVQRIRAPSYYDAGSIASR